MFSSNRGKVFGSSGQRSWYTGNARPNAIAGSTSDVLPAFNAPQGDGQRSKASDSGPAPQMNRGGAVDVAAGTRMAGAIPSWYVGRDKAAAFRRPPKVEADRVGGARTLPGIGQDLTTIKLRKEQLAYFASRLATTPENQWRQLLKVVVPLGTRPVQILPQTMQLLQVR